MQFRTLVLGGMSLSMNTLGIKGLSLFQGKIKKMRFRTLVLGVGTYVGVCLYLNSLLMTD